MPQSSSTPNSRVINVDASSVHPDPHASFAHQLVALTDVTNQLSKANSFDDLCRDAVILGRSRLGFDRLGIWFEDLPNQQMVGSFGTDEQGELRDERSQRVPILTDHPSWRALHQRKIIHRAENFTLYNDKQEVVGYGSSISAALWDGDEVIGVISADNFLKRQPITEQQVELLGLYAVNLGHLCARVQMMETLRYYTERLKGVNRVVLAILEARSLQDIARVVFPHLRHFIPCDRVDIVTFDFERGHAQMIAVESKEANDLPSKTFALGDFQLDQMLTVEAPFILEIRAPTGSVYLDELAKMGFESYWGVPLFVQADLFGVLNLGTRRKGVFSVEHQTVVKEIITPLEIWFQQMELREELQQHSSELEQRVAERTTELKEVNQELESFSYQVSHDLRAPLRAISGFSGLFMNKYGTGLDEKGQEYLSMIQTSAKRMETLINELLTFSRLSRQPLTKREFLLKDLVLEVWKNLMVEQPTRQVTFTVDDLPVCHADPILLRQVFVNLLGNALKFSRNRELARIHVGVKMAESGRVYWVEDNGAGFDMAYADQLFIAFRRLHSDMEFEGTGIGLAIVQRIIQRHGGQVWAEGIEGQGARFFFML